MTTGEISDGYHTFNELYLHRMALTRALTLHIGGVRSMLHDDGTMFPGMFIVVFELDGNQCSYHYEMRHWYKFSHLETVDKAPEWDGHSADDVIKRCLDYKG